MRSAVRALWDTVGNFEHLGVTVLCVCLLSGLLAFDASAATWQRPSTGTDLWYSGFLHAEASYTDVTGSVYDFEEGYFHGKEDGSLDLKGAFHANGFLREGLKVNSSFLFDTRYRRYPQRYWDRRFWDTFRMKIVMDTPRPINDRWKFHARAVYDREDSWRSEYPDARLLMEPIDHARLEVFAHLESKHWTFEGGDLKPDFGGRGFVLYQRDLLGLKANGHNDFVDAELTGGRVKGTSFLQTPDDSLGVRADGTAGPYRLAHAPIVRGSEVVAIEVRDRFDQTILLRRTTQRRNVDYTVDYLRGVVTFMEPVLSETFEGHPVYISVQYSFDERDAGYYRYLAASRTHVQLGESARAGVLYAGVYDDAGSWRGDETGRPPAQRRAAYGGTFEADLFDRTRIEAAAALSDSGRLGEEDKNGAVGIHLESRSIDRLALIGDYQRIEHNFEPLDNRSLVGQTNRQQTKLQGVYQVADNIELEGGGRRTKSANPEFDDQAYTDQSTFAGLRFRPYQLTELAYHHEWRTAVDEKEVHQKDEYRETSTLEAQQRFSESRLRLGAEREHFTNHVMADSTGSQLATWRLRGALDYRPWTWLDARAALKTEVAHDRDTERSTARKDRAELGATFSFHPRYSLRGDLEKESRFSLDDKGYKFSGGDKTRGISAYSLGADLRPWEPVQLLFGYDQEETRDEINDVTERESELLRAEGYYFATPDLEFHSAFTREDLRDLRKIGIDQGLLRRYERRFELDVTYNYHVRLSFFSGYMLKLRRIFDPGRSDTDVHQYRVGINYHITPRWELMGRVRYTTLDGEPIDAASGSSVTVSEALENHRWIATGEIAWDLAHMWRIALGYESLEYAVDSVTDSPDDYDANRFYLKLMQKF